MFHFQSYCMLIQPSKHWMNSVICSLLQPRFHKEKMKQILKVCSFIDMIWHLHFTSPHVSILSLCRFFKQIFQPGFFIPSPSCLWTSSYFPTPFPISDLEPTVNQICWHHNDTNKSQGKDYVFRTRPTCLSFHTNQKTHTWNNIATTISNHVVPAKKSVIGWTTVRWPIWLIETSHFLERDSIPCNSWSAYAAIFRMRLFLSSIAIFNTVQSLTIVKFLL